MSFREILFSPKYSYGASGGPEFKTKIIENSGGFESRNADWSIARGRWDVSHLLVDSNNTDGWTYLHNFFYAVARGRAYGFRFKWWGDFCADQSLWVDASNISNGTIDPTISYLPLIGTGNASNDEFQLIKKYTIGAYSYSHTIYKPVADSVRIWVAGTEKTVTTDFTYDTTTGLVTFESGSIPDADEEVRAWFEFDYPVRFDTDSLDLAINHYDRSDWTGIPIIEIKSGGQS